MNETAHYLANTFDYLSYLLSSQEVLNQRIGIKLLRSLIQDGYSDPEMTKLLPKCIEMLDTPEIDAKTVRFVNYGLMRYAEMEDFDVVLQVLSKLSPLLHKDSRNVEFSLICFQELLDYTKFDALQLLTIGSMFMANAWDLILDNDVETPIELRNKARGLSIFCLTQIDGLAIDFIQTGIAKLTVRHELIKNLDVFRLEGVLPHKVIYAADLINYFLPLLPNELSYFESGLTRLSRQVNKELIQFFASTDGFIREALVPFFNVKHVLLASCDVGEDHHSLALLKMILYASEQTLIEVMPFELFSIHMVLSLKHGTMTTRVLCMQMVYTLLKKIPHFNLTHSLGDDVIFEIIRIPCPCLGNNDSTDDKERCSYFADCKAFIINKVLPGKSDWNQLISIRNNLMKGDLEIEAIAQLAAMFKKTHVILGDIIHSGIASKLLSYWNTMKGPKTFLRYFIEKEQNEGPSQPFKNFVRHVVLCFESLLEKSTLNHLESNEKFTIRMKMVTFLKVISQLYFFNKEWRCILRTTKNLRGKNFIPSEEFVSRKFENDVWELIADGDFHKKNSSWISHLLVQCPAILPLHVKRFVFYYNYLGERRRAYFEQRIGYEELSTFTANVGRENAIERFDDLMRDDSFFYRVWSFKFIGEMGTGKGPTKEFYSILSREYQKHDLKMWIGDSVGSSDKYTFSAPGLFPSPEINNLNKWFSLGRMMAKAIMDFHILDLPIHEEFFWLLLRPRKFEMRDRLYSLLKIKPELTEFIQKLLDTSAKVTEILGDASLKHEDAIAAIKGLQYDDGCNFEDLMINFTMPGYPDMELVEGGKDQFLDQFNIEKYIECLCTELLENKVKEQVGQFTEGYSKLMPLSSLQMFLPGEIKDFICGWEYEQWTVEYLEKNFILKDYEADSQPIKYLFDILSKFDIKEQRSFLQFVTSTPRLPSGGLSNYDISVQRIAYDNPDDYLPTSSTCSKCLNLPEYNSYEVTKEKLLLAISNECNTFEFV